jgi:hypothetical protein
MPSRSPRNRVDGFRAPLLFPEATLPPVPARSVVKIGWLRTLIQLRSVALTERIIHECVEKLLRNVDNLEEEG